MPGHNKNCCLGVVFVDRVVERVVQVPRDVVVERVVEVEVDEQVVVVPDPPATPPVSSQSGAMLLCDFNGTHSNTQLK